MGSNTSQPQAGAVNTFEYGDTLTEIHGDHSLAYGVDIRQIKRGNFYEDIRARGEYDFNGVLTGNAILGALPSAAQQQLLTLCPPGSCGFGNGVAVRCSESQPRGLMGSPVTFRGSEQEFGRPRVFIGFP
jgi:hypothetical protein